MAGVLTAGVSSLHAADCKNRGVMDDKFCDENMDLVADAPKDPKKWRDPSTLVFTYTPVEDPAVYKDAFADFQEYLSEATGKKVKVGSFPFRVKRIPTPVAYIAGRTGTIALSKRELGDGVIQAKLEGFVFDLRVKVKSFELITTVNGDVKTVKVNGNKMNDKAKGFVKRSSRGQRFYLENMAVKMPDGRVVTMGNVTVKIK